MLVARRVLEDCRLAYEELEEEEDLKQWRIKWIGALALIRMVGHVLHKVDSRNPTVKKLSKELYVEWKDPQADHLIFREFIERQRNLALKEYRLGILETDEVPLEVLNRDSNGEVFSISTDMYRPLEEGPFVGQDARDVYAMALSWWGEQLRRLESRIRP